MTPDPTRRPPRLLCFNAKFSPNLGDGLLSECLEQTLCAAGADAGTTSVDLAARNAYGDAMPGRSTVMAVLQALPPALRQAAVRLPLAIAARRSWGPHYARALAGGDGVVIGGGNLIADLDLNFPTKLALAVDSAARLNLPVAIYACGMAAHFTKTGLGMFARAFASPNVKAVFLRDTASAALWDRHLADKTGHRAQVVRDPGLLASLVFPQAPRPARAQKVVGLGLMSHLAIRYHSDSAPASSRLDQWYLDVAAGLLDQGAIVQVFTNGSPEDRIYAARMKDALLALGARHGGALQMLDQRTPAQLCAHLAGFDALIAYRMHAVIGAYSYGAPAIALAWDAKLAQFMDSVGRGDHMLDVAKTPAADCVTRALRAAEVGLPAADVARVVAEARVGVDRLFAMFQP
ncbi:MAG: polysaccharide pyruvyl transferase family protein [Pseudomonadota bacterium]